MTEPSPDRDDAWLRALVEDDHVDDAGFTEAVLARLPPKRRRRVALRDLAIGLGGCAAGVVGALAAWRGGAVFELAASPAHLLPLAVLVVLGLWGALASADA